MSEEKYELDTDGDIEAIDIENTTDFTVEERGFLQKIENLTNELADAGITCFFASKFPTQSNPSAAWNFGTDPNVSYKTFAKDYAPLLLHVTSNFTGTKVVASNVDSGETVYEVDPRDGGQDDVATS